MLPASSVPKTKPSAASPGGIGRKGNAAARKHSSIRRLARAAVQSFNGASSSSGKKNHAATPNAESLFHVEKWFSPAASSGV
ncbi:MAG: hypothetical protein QM811_13275 [Pirellulales bacterium]